MKKFKYIQIDCHKKHKKLLKILTKKFLIQEYIKNKKSMHKIAKENNCGYGTIPRYLRKYNIKIRTLEESRNPPKGKNHWNWKGKYISPTGYVFIYVFYHPYKSKVKYVLQHRLVMEAYLNNVSYKKWIEYGTNDNYPKNARYLNREEIVHHINGDRGNNRIENLMLFPNHSSHMNFKYHGEKTFICKYCKKSQKRKI